MGNKGAFICFTGPELEPDIITFLAVASSTHYLYICVVYMKFASQVQAINVWKLSLVVLVKESLIWGKYRALHLFRNYFQCLLCKLIVLIFFFKHDLVSSKWRMNKSDLLFFFPMKVILTMVCTL